MSARTRRTRRRSSTPPPRWWLALGWTVAATACLNVLLGYLIAQALWPARIPTLAAPWLLGLALACGLFLALAVRGWADFMRARRRTP